MSSKMVYCKLATEDHSRSIKYSDCLIELNRMISKEGAACSFFDSDWTVLDLDALEIKLKALERRSNQYQTCDFAVGIKQKNETKILLVECRFNYKNANNLSSEELNGKVKGSMAILGHTPPIHNSVFFIFSDKVRSLAVRKLREMKSNRKEFLAVTLNEFRNLFTIPCSTECRATSCYSYA